VHFYRSFGQHVFNGARIEHDLTNPNIVGRCAGRFD
jgi:hypothetical protein